MAPRWPLEVHFGLFWALVAKLLSDGFLGLILSCSGLWWQNGSQMASGSSFWAVLGFGGKMTLRWLLGAHFELFWALVAKWLPDSLSLVAKWQ